MWKPFRIVGDFFKALFGRVKELVTKLWDVASPFVGAVLSEAAKKLWETSQDLLLEAFKYVKSQGFPDTKDKQKAFGEYMLDKAKDEWSELKESEQNFLREMTVSIAKKAGV